MGSLPVFLSLGIAFGTRCNPVNWLRPRLQQAIEFQLRLLVPQILQVLHSIAMCAEHFSCLVSMGPLFGHRMHHGVAEQQLPLGTAQPDELTHIQSVVPVGRWC